MCDNYNEHQLKVLLRAQLPVDQTQEQLAVQEGSWERTTEARSQKAAPGRRQARQLGWTRSLRQCARSVPEKCLVSTRHSGEALSLTQKPAKAGKYFIFDYLIKTSELWIYCTCFHQSLKLDWLQRSSNSHRFNTRSQTCECRPQPENWKCSGFDIFPSFQTFLFSPLKMNVRKHHFLPVIDGRPSPLAFHCPQLCKSLSADPANNPFL